jgi:hypothetical protein
MSGPSRRGALCLAAFMAMALISSPAPADAGEAPLAIRGYDPVAYFTDGAPAHGRPDMSLEWDERRYLFSTAEHREMFKADPMRFAPQFASYCAVSLARGEVEDGNPEYWLIRDGRLYLFGKPVGPALFEQSFAGNVARAEANRAIVKQR